MADVNIENRYPRERVVRVYEDSSAGWIALVIVLLILAGIFLIFFFYQNFDAEETGDRIIDRTREVTDFRREEIIRTNSTSDNIDINIVPNSSGFNLSYR